MEEKESKAAEESECRREGGSYGGKRRMAGQRSAVCFCVTAAWFHFLFFFYNPTKQGGHF